MHKLTYGDLEAVLQQFGFVKRNVNGDTVYEVIANDVLIALPTLPSEEPLRPHHYVTARHTVDGRGVVDADTFEQAMCQRGTLPDGVIPLTARIK